MEQEPSAAAESSSASPAADRIDLLERRIARISRERDAYKAKVALLARVTQPFAGKTHVELQRLIRDTQPEVVDAWIRAIGAAQESEGGADDVKSALRRAALLCEAVLDGQDGRYQAKRVLSAIEHMFEANPR